jgi:hypothetical protein
MIKYIKALVDADGNCASVKGLKCFSSGSDTFGETFCPLYGSCTLVLDKDRKLKLAKEYLNREIKKAMDE